VIYGLCKIASGEVQSILGLLLHFGFGGMCYISSGKKTENNVCIVKLCKGYKGEVWWLLTE